MCEDYAIRFRPAPRARRFSLLAGQAGESVDPARAPVYRPAFFGTPPKDCDLDGVIARAGAGWRPRRRIPGSGGGAAHQPFALKWGMIFRERIS